MKHLLLLSVVLFATTTMWVITHTGRQKHLSISLHVAQACRTRFVFGVAAAVATALAAATIFGWLLPHYQANMFAYIIFWGLDCRLFLDCFRSAHSRYLAWPGAQFCRMGHGLRCSASNGSSALVAAASCGSRERGHSVGT